MQQRPPYRSHRVLELLDEQGPHSLKAINGRLNHPLAGQFNKVAKALGATFLALRFVSAIHSLRRAAELLLGCC